MELNFMQKRTWAEIDLDALEYNYKLLRKITPPSALICCTVKADAYGHGSVRVAALYESLGAGYLAVSNVKEAIILRDGGITLPILILGYTDPSCARVLAEKNITQCVYSYDYGIALSKYAETEEVTLKVHIKLDVGMGRIGFSLDDETSFSQILEVCRCKSFITEGIFTHFPMAGDGEKDMGITEGQYELFCDMIARLENENINFKIKHCANSATGIKYPQFSMDMVRYGISLYGALPSSDIVDIGLKNTLSLKSMVSNVKRVKAGQSIGYGSEYTAEKDVMIATLPIGYGDGLKRENYPNGTKISVGGVLCEITGRVCMDQTMIDVSAVSSVKRGDEAVIYGSGSPVSLEDFSKNNSKIPYETMCEVSARVPRVYMKNGAIESIRESFV